jgi:hypothetical protein
MNVDSASVAAKTVAAKERTINDFIIIRIIYHSI